LKIAVSATNGNLDAQIDPRFGRCSHFIFVDSETMQFEAVQNTSQNAPSGAGIQAAQTVGNKGAKAVLTGRVGPNASQVLSSLGIKIVTGVSGTVREAVENFKSGQLKGSSTPIRPTDLGARRGLGRGRRMGRGGGGGMGFKCWQPPQYDPQAPINIPAIPAASRQMPKEEEALMLENQMQIIQRQMEQIKSRLAKLRE
jgi:predicted Fe-Mo cluster-binding NifX family protein